MILPTEREAHAKDPTIRVIDITGRGETKFGNGSTATISGEVAGAGRVYRFFASRTLFDGDSISPRTIFVSLRTQGGKHIADRKCQQWRDAVRADSRIVSRFAEQPGSAVP